MTRTSSILRHVATLAVLAAVGCAAHPARPAFRASVWIGDRGISIPLPPPSILKAPRQRVDVHGEVVGDGPVVQDAIARVVDLRGDAVASVELVAGDTAFSAEGLEIDLTDNCLEVWLESDEGSEGDHALFSALVVVLEDGTEAVEVAQGCAE